ncbi:MAG: hypothetical protein RL726_1746, partial [Actinomycetota bacterium]
MLVGDWWAVERATARTREAQQRRAKQCEFADGVDRPLGDNAPMNSRAIRRRVNPIERVLNLLTLLSRAETPMTREQIVAAMSRGESPYPLEEDPQRQLFTSDKNVISRDLGIPVRTQAGVGDEAGQTRYY